MKSFRLWRVLRTEAAALPANQGSPRLCSRSTPERNPGWQAKQARRFNKQTDIYIRLFMEPLRVQGASLDPREAVSGRELLRHQAEPGSCT